MGVKYVSIKEACTLTGKSPRTIRYAISNGKLQSRKVKGARMIALPSLEKLYEIEKRGEKRESAIEDTVTTDNNVFIDYLQRQVEDLNSKLAEKEKLIAKKDEQIATVNSEFKQFRDKKDEEIQRLYSGLVGLLKPPTEQPIDIESTEPDEQPQEEPEEQRRGGIWARLFGRG